jgi:chemotaxis protein histidine kinase CheA
VRLGAYLKAAFLNRWNLLALAGGSGFAVLSGRPDIVLPLVLAAETAYVALLGTHPKFQKYVDALEHKEQRATTSKSTAQALRQILQTLPFPALDRFEKLRSRCLELRQIATDLKRTRGEVHHPQLDDFHIEGLDKLLWIFIRLLFTQHSLQKFLERTNVKAIQDDIEELTERLNKITVDDSSPIAQKMRRTLEDNLKTSRDRLANYQKAHENHQLVELEIDRLENKINSLAELAVNRQEPDFIAGQVDAVAGSMLEMEKTMNDLQFATGLSPIDEDVPDLIQPSSKRIKAR